MDNRDNELFNGIIDIPTNSENNTESNLEINVNQSTLPSESMEVIDVPMNNNEEAYVGSVELKNDEPEIIDFDLELKSEEINAQGKAVNHELLQNLSKDTNNLVNPNMIINPLRKSEEPVASVSAEEPRVDYDEIKTKKGYVFMAIIFLIIIVFIIFLPQIMSFIGI